MWWLRALWVWRFTVVGRNVRRTWCGICDMGCVTEVWRGCGWGGITAIILNLLLPEKLADEELANQEVKES